MGAMEAGDDDFVPIVSPISRWGVQVKGAHKISKISGLYS